MRLIGRALAVQVVVKVHHALLDAMRWRAPIDR